MSRLLSYRTNRTLPALAGPGAALMAVALLAGPAHAQMPGMGGGHHGHHAQQQQTEAEPPPPTTVQTWPRLDPGSILCASQADLTSYQEKMAGTAVPASTTPPHCQVIMEPTSIKILTRNGISQTQVQVSDSSQVGWTNDYLPDKNPGG